MHATIGIPRGLLYHEFGDLWTNFFHNLKADVKISPETNKQILDSGAMLAIDESCLPLKIYLGHVAALLPECTHIFVPRVTGYYSNFFMCAKFAGLPDMISNTFGLSPDKIVAPNIENGSWLSQLKAINTISSRFGLPRTAGYRAYQQAKSDWRNKSYPNVPSSRAKVAVIGHSYLLQDAFFSRDIFTTLTARDIIVLTPDHVPNKILYKEAQAFHPDIYWQLSAKLAGAVRFFSNQNDVSGIILVSSFGCGPDSLVNEYIEHHVLKGCGKPYIILNLDEHTGNAGIVTRLEAFLDLMDWRKKT